LKGKPISIDWQIIYNIRKKKKKKQERGIVHLGVKSKAAGQKVFYLK
jgi:hypothetical protein